MVADQIFDLIYHGNGGFTYSDLVSMPVFKRNYFYRKLIKAKEDEKKEYDKIKSSSSSKKSKPRLPHK